MKSPLPFPLTAFCLCVLAASLAQAADFRLVALNQIKGLSRLEFIGPEGVEQVPVSIAHFSDSYKIPANGEVAFYDKAPAKGENKAPLFVVRFPENASDTIVLLGGQGDDGMYRYGLIDDSVHAFPTGSVYIMNFMKDPVMVKLGPTVVTVDSGARRIVPVIENKKEPFNDGVKFATEINGNAQVFSMSSWYLLPSMKIFCVIFPDKSGIPQIRRIRLT